MLDTRIVIMNRKKAVSSDYGLDGKGIEWEDTCCVSAWLTWNRGMRALNAGALDVYGVVMIRMRYHQAVTMRSRVRIDGETYQILPETFHSDKRANTVQFTAQVIVND